MKVLITGISGFLGQYLCERLLKDGYEVYGLYQNASSAWVNKLPKERCFIADLRNQAVIEHVITMIKPDFVVHLAAKTEVALSFDNYKEVSDVNYLGTTVLAEANRKYNPNLKLFIMASTMETYGHQDPRDGPFTEETEQKPMAPYAVAKLACEKYLAFMRYAYEFPYTILRQTNAYGRTDNDFFVIERIITQMLWNEECNLGEPDPIRNFIYVDDLIELYVTILKNYNKARGETFVVGPDNALSIENLADKIAKKLGWTGEVNWHTIPIRPGEVYYLNSVATKAKNLLEWEPKTLLEEGLDKTIAIWQKQILVHGTDDGSSG